MLLIRIEGKRSGGYNDEYDNHTQFLEKSFSQHIDNLDAHVERIEKRVEFLCRCMNRIPETRGRFCCITRKRENRPSVFIFIYSCIHVFMYMYSCIHTYSYSYSCLCIHASLCIHAQTKEVKQGMASKIDPRLVYILLGILFITPAAASLYVFFKKTREIDRKYKKKFKKKKK
jgi:hypothetical protein